MDHQSKTEPGNHIDPPSEDEILESELPEISIIEDETQLAERSAPDSEDPWGDAETRVFPAEFEKREFNRAKLSDQKLGLKFKNEIQFARKYIEDISLGGMFVKTNQPYEIGTTIPISLNIPRPGTDGQQQIEVELDATVVRRTPQGIALEFHQMDAVTRRQLEAYVKSVLPQGLNLQTGRMRASSQERLDQVRQSKEVSKKRRERTFLLSLTFGLLILLNGVLVVRSVVEEVDFGLQQSRWVQIEDKKILIDDIAGVSTTSDGEINIETRDGQSLPVKDISKLPYSLRHSIGVVKSIRPKKVQRKSKNAGNLINVGRSRD